MPDPSVFRDMDKAAGRLADAVQAGEQVTIFGDYDVDGATSAALLIRLLRELGLDARAYIPDRLMEGYGPSGEALVRIAEGGASLIVTVVAGAGFEALAMAKAAGSTCRGRPSQMRERPPGRLRDRQSEPARRKRRGRRPWPPRRGRHGLPAWRGFVARAARARLFRRQGRAQADRNARPGGARHRRRRGAAPGPQPRLRDARAQGDGGPPQHRTRRAGRRRPPQPRARMPRPGSRLAPDQRRRPRRQVRSRAVRLLTTEIPRSARHRAELAIGSTRSGARSRPRSAKRPKGSLPRRATAPSCSSPLRAGIPA